MINGHGNELHKYHGKIICDFSSNVLWTGINYELKSILIQEISNSNVYPEPNAESLQLKIAQFYSINCDNVFVANGSTEALYLIAQAFYGKKSIVFTPSFSEYEDACIAFKHQIKFVPNSVIHDDLFFDSDVVWIGNPNNPDGKIISCSTIELWCSKYPTIYFIIDEAYASLCYGYESTITLLQLYSNLIVVKSLTKSFVIPGIRLGFILAQNCIIKSLITIPWRINTLAISAGNFILENHNKICPDINDIYNKSKIFQNSIHSCKGFEVAFTTCNYFLVKMRSNEVKKLKEYLISNYGILIRDASNFRGLNNSWFRISVQSANENELLIEALNNFKYE